jgi:hypothetical protein
LLNNEEPLRNVFETLGGVWSDVQSDWRATKSTLETASPPLSTAQVQQKITDILGRVGTTTFPAEAAEEIKKALKAASPWAPAKRSGIRALPGGEPTQTAKRLLRTLRARGLFVVECGELERFAPSVGGHGPGWVASALERSLLDDSELGEARRFVSDVLGFVPQRADALGSVSTPDLSGPNAAG